MKDVFMKNIISVSVHIAALVISGVWLAFLGNWILLAAGIAVILFFPLIFSLFMLPAVPMSIAMDRAFFQGNKKTASFWQFWFWFYYNFVLLVFFAAMLILPLYCGDTNNMIPFLWAWAVVSISFQWNAIKNHDDAKKFALRWFYIIFGLTIFALYVDLNVFGYWGIFSNIAVALFLIAHSLVVPACWVHKSQKAWNILGHYKEPE